MNDEKLAAQYPYQRAYLPITNWMGPRIVGEWCSGFEIVILYQTGSMAYLKGVLGTVAAFFLAALGPTIWTQIHGLSGEKQTGLTAVAGETLESIVWPWFLPLAVLFSVFFYMAGRFKNNESRILLFWIPTIIASTMGLGFWALFAIILARFQKG